MGNIPTTQPVHWMHDEPIPPEKYSNPEVRYSSNELDQSTAHPLTIQNLIEALRYIWPGPEEEQVKKWAQIRQALQFSHIKATELISSCKNNKEKMEKIINFWLMWYPYPSWRFFTEWVISYLSIESISEMCKWTEPLNDSSLTVDNLKSFLTHVPPSLQLCQPHTRVNKLISQGIGSYDELMTRKITWWLALSPDASWEYIAGELYYRNKSEALQMLKDKYLIVKKDPTLTFANLKADLTSVVDWDSLARNLRIPNSTVASLKTPHIDPSEFQDALIKEYLGNHPTPSWKRVAKAMYNSARFGHCSYGALETIQSKYIYKDNSLNNLCLRAVAKYIPNPDDTYLLPLPSRLQSTIYSYTFVVTDDPAYYSVYAKTV